MLFQPTPFISPFADAQPARGKVPQIGPRHDSLRSRREAVEERRINQIYDVRTEVAPEREVDEEKRRLGKGMLDERLLCGGGQGNKRVGKVFFDPWKVGFQSAARHSDLIEGEFIL